MGTADPTFGSTGIDPAARGTDGADDRSAAAEGRDRPEREFVGTGWFWSLIVGGLIALAAIIFVLQNSDAVAVKFLGWQGDVSLAGVVLVVALAAIVADELFGTVYRRRRRRRLTERARFLGR
jgi:uncharacterized integral membrane protein